MPETSCLAEQHMYGASREILEPVTLRAAFEATLECGRLRCDSHVPPVPSRSVQQLLAAIHDDVFDPQLNVQSLRARCRVQDNNISSRFRSEVGQSIKDYIDGLRLDTARRLLQETNFSIFEVSLAVGYYHPQTFYRAFHRWFKCRPGDVREPHDQ
ncbi:MAG: helix-turn-helix transcriptional regulator [Cyanobacteria bacterium]|nr:helix-turn-helix transcriptional regulator [Cyanobacteriota bacterium]